MSNNQWLWPLCICLWAAAGRSLGSWCLRTLVWLVNFDCLVLQCKDISLRTLNTMNGGMSSITRHSYLYLWLWISLRKPLLDVTCDGEKHLLHIQVCLGTLKDTEICESKTTANSVFLLKKLFTEGVMQVWQATYCFKKLDPVLISKCLSFCSRYSLKQ